MVAKWPLTDMTEGAVGCRVLVEGRRCEDRAAAMTQKKVSSGSTRYQRLQALKSAAKDARDVADVY